MSCNLIPYIIVIANIINMIRIEIHNAAVPFPFAYHVAKANIGVKRENIPQP